MTLSLPLPPADAKPFDIVGVGESSLDLLAVLPAWPQPNQKIALERCDFLPGGQTATALVACARLGWRARYVGAFGDDEFGASVVAALAAEGVDTQVVERSGATSRTAVILVDRATGARTVLEHRDRRLAVEEEDLSPAVFTSGRLLLVDATDLPAAVRAARAAHTAGISTIVDVDQHAPGVDDLLAEIDVIIAPGAFFADASGGSVEVGLTQVAHRFGAALVVATLGERGSLARCGEATIRTAAHPVDVVDTTGAGDAFRGGFASAWLKLGPGAPVETLLTYANRVAGLNCRAIGAQTGLPGPNEVPWSVSPAYHSCGLRC